MEGRTLFLRYTLGERRREQVMVSVLMLNVIRKPQPKSLMLKRDTIRTLARHEPWVSHSIT